MTDTLHGDCTGMAGFRMSIFWAALAVLVVSGKAGASNIDLPVATSGTDQWAGVIAKAMTFGAGDQDTAMKNFESFQARAMGKLQKTAAELQKLEHGDISGILSTALKNAVDIQAPVFFANGGGPQSTLSSSIAAIQFGYTGLSISPCAIPITPTGVAIVPQGVEINPIGVYITPEGVNVQPQGLNVSPTLIVIGPYDTTVAGQGLNVAPALISIAPTKTVVNPTGPLAITDTLVSVTVPALP